MSRKKIQDSVESAAAEISVSETTLQSTPERVVKFLRAVGTVPAIRAALSTRGYDDEEHQRGWDLLQAASGHRAAASDFATKTDPAVSKAIAEIDAWDEDGFRTVRAALKNRFPAQYDALTAGLAPSTGAAAVVGVEALLSRIDALHKSHDATDKAAFKMLEKRGLTAAIVAHLKSLVAIAQAGAAPEAPVVEDPSAADDHRKALVDLRVWFEEWSELARVVIKRRDRLIRLGLATRKSPRKVAPSPAPGGTTTAPATDGSASRLSGVEARRAG